MRFNAMRPPQQGRATGLVAFRAAANNQPLARPTGLSKDTAKDPAKFAAKANAQLVSTKQAAQEKDPLSGGATKADKTAKVAGVEVAFCCENCQGKVAKASADEATELVFNDKAFEKGFKVTAKK